MITCPFTLSQYTQAKEWRLNNDIDHILDHDVSIPVTQETLFFGGGEGAG